MTTIIGKNSVVLFQGDSITDAGRNRTDPTNLGGGYAMMAASWFAATRPSLNVQFLNRGVSGDRAKDLEARWTDDCLALKPTWVSIMIGINDTWRRFDSNEATSTESFETSYRKILQRAVQTLNCRFILLEPFVLPEPRDRRKWREDLDPKIDVVRHLAREFDAVLVPLDGIFAEASTRRDCAFWAGDGVHPSLPGHALIAQSWLKAVKA